VTVRPTDAAALAGGAPGDADGVPVMVDSDGAGRAGDLRAWIRPADISE
jgi:hypothetical protein